jgi:hypothetical protein
MFTVNDFIAQYESYTDGQLAFIHMNPDNYNKEANDAAKIIIERKGGLDELFKRLEVARTKQVEINRIKKETEDLGSQGFDSSFLKTNAASAILSKEELHDIIDDKYDEVVYAIEDKKITPKTIAGSIVGGAIGAVVGGILWGLQMIYSHRVFYLLFIGLVIFCYGCIKLFTRQSQNNKAVFISTAISAVLAAVIGQLLLNIVGFID